MAGIDRERIERVARIYASNQDASQALGINMRSFGRLCRQYGIETPYAPPLPEIAGRPEGAERRK